VQRAVEEIVHQALLAETHLALGRMHVYIDAGRIQREEQHERRMAPMEQHIRISLAYRVRHHAIAHEAAVDVEELLIGL